MTKSTVITMEKRERKSIKKNLTYPRLLVFTTCMVVATANIVTTYILKYRQFQMTFVNFT